MGNLLPRLSVLVSLLVGACLFSAAALAHPVLMISVDGLRPADVLDAQQRGLNLPVLGGFVQNGAYATAVDNELPTLTYPNHTTLVTGVTPAVHGIANNQTFDPLGKNRGGWYWYSADIKSPTLWDAVHAQHRIVASIGWPVTVGNRSIDDNIPEFWRAATPDDLKLIDAVSTPGLIDELKRRTGVEPAEFLKQSPEADVARTRVAAALIALRHPALTTLHLVSLDHDQHLYGPGTQQAYRALETLDGAIGTLIGAARQAEPDLVVAIVSDHGFAPVNHDVNLMSAFAEAGLVTIDPTTRRITDWQAEPWSSGGSAAIVLAHPDDAALQQKVSLLLAKLAADPENGIERVIDKGQIEAMGGSKGPSFWVDFKIGYAAGLLRRGPLVTPSRQKGTHGYFPTHPEMHATLMIVGPDVPAHASLGEIDMRSIAPTLAKLLGVPLPSATAKPLF
jgi:predicted AlkP superfamily pyrophosphatase or phosphodiesterase